MEKNKESKILTFVDKFKWIYEKLGVDYNSMRSILKVKLLMDSRTNKNVFNINKPENKDSNASLLKLFGINFGIGFFFMLMTAFIPNIIISMSIFFTLLMFMILSTLISNFTSLILDIKDKNIIGTKPVSNKTITSSKITHITIYMLTISIGLSGCSLFASLFHGALFFLIFFIEIILVTIFSIVITCFIYLITLKFFDGEKLKDLINAIQIFIVLIFSVGMQFLGHLFDFVDLANNKFNPIWWKYLISPMWFSAPLYMIKNHIVNTPIIIFSLLAFLVPIMLLIIFSKSSKYFEKYLQKLNNNSSLNKTYKQPLYIKISKFLCENKEERAFFKFGCEMMTKERKFKLSVYPSLGLSIAFPFIFMLNTFRESKGFSSWFSYIENTRYYITIDLCAILLGIIITMVKYSENYKGAWIFRIVPVENASAIFKGTIKAIFYKLIMPIFLFECLIFLFLFKIKVIPNLVASFLTLLLFSIITFRMMDKKLPFTQPFEAARNASGDIGATMTSMFLIGIFIAIHYAVNLIWFGIYIYLVVLMFLNYLLWKKAFNIKLCNLK